MKKFQQKKNSMLIEKEIELKKNIRGFSTCVILQHLMKVIDIIIFMRDEN